MRELLTELTRALEQGRGCVYCSVVETRGSTPQKAGAAMLVFADGSQCGTLGGGCVEAEVKQRALRVLGAGSEARPEILTFNLDDNYGWDDGLICGGRMMILADPLPGPNESSARTRQARGYFGTLRDFVERGSGCTEAIVTAGLAAGNRYLFGPTGELASCLKEGSLPARQAAAPVRTTGESAAPVRTTGESAAPAREDFLASAADSLSVRQAAAPVRTTGESAAPAREDFLASAADSLSVRQAAAPVRTTGESAAPVRTTGESAAPAREDFLASAADSLSVRQAAEAALAESIRRRLRSLDERPRPYLVQGVAYLPILPRITLLIVGGGHVGQAVGRLAAEVDFEVWALDDRAAYASRERFPAATRLLVGDIGPTLERLVAEEIGPATYCLIVTRGHHHDEEALYHLVRSRAGYVGMIGSKRKIRLIYDDLQARGVSAEALARVHAPLGLDIGSQTVPEIAISIVAELIACRNLGVSPPLARSPIAV
jgi:xanthine/CO dehydrogenase XdhC/CoxF family maturation factor